MFTSHFRKDWVLNCMYMFVFVHVGAGLMEALDPLELKLQSGGELLIAGAWAVPSASNTSYFKTLHLFQGVCAGCCTHTAHLVREQLLALLHHPALGA